MKRLMLFVVFAAVLFGTTSYPEKTDEIKAISYNIRMSGNLDADGENCWTYRKEASLNLSRDNRPAIFCLQETSPDQQI